MLKIVDLHGLNFFDISWVFEKTAASHDFQILAVPKLKKC